MDWTSLIVGLGGLAVGAFSNYLAFKDRTTSFQETIHQRQLDAVITTFETIKFPFFVSVLIVFFERDDKDKEELENHIQGFQDSIHKLLNVFVAGTKDDIVLPEELHDLKRNIVSDLVEVITKRERLSKKEKLELVNNITSNRIEFIQESRKLIGVDELSNLNVKMFGREKNVDEMLTKLSNSSVETLLKVISYT